MFLAELSYWADLNTDPNQSIPSASGGTVNVFGKVFGTDGGYNGASYQENKIGDNPLSIFSTHTMAAFLGS